MIDPTHRTQMKRQTFIHSKQKQTNKTNGLNRLNKPVYKNKKNAN